MSISELDKFYTKKAVATTCINTLHDVLDIDLWVEPSAGDGAFLTLLPDPKIGLDIAPEAEDIIKQDFFTYLPPSNKRIAVVGNPPFGKNSSLAIKFFNHAAKWATLIAFIVPKTFRKTSVQNRLSLRWELFHEMELPKNSFLYTEDGITKPYDVPCLWQIWVPGVRNKVELPTTHSDWTWVTKDEAKYAIRRVGGLAGKCFSEFENLSENSNYFIRCSTNVYDKFNFLYRDFQIAARNTAGNPSLSKTEIVRIYTDN